MDSLKAANVIDSFIIEYRNALINCSDELSALLIPHSSYGGSCDCCSSPNTVFVETTADSNESLYMCIVHARLFINRQMQLISRWLIHCKASNIMMKHVNKDSMAITYKHFDAGIIEYICEQCCHQCGLLDSEHSIIICHHCRACGTVSYFTTRLMCLHATQLLSGDMCCVIIGMLFDHLAFIHNERAMQQLESISDRALTFTNLR